MKACVYLFMVFILCSCTSWKSNLISHGDYNSAIHNAITDFTNTSPLMKEDKVFSISYKEINDSIIAISILGYPNKFYITDGKPMTLIPSDYLEIKNKLFYWGDSDSIKDNSEMIKKLEEYNLVEYNADIFEEVIDDAKKAEQYYFCKNDLTKYTKVKTSVAMGYYKAKLPKCTKN